MMYEVSRRPIPIELSRPIGEIKIRNFDRTELARAHNAIHDMMGRYLVSVLRENAPEFSGPFLKPANTFFVGNAEYAERHRKASSGNNPDEDHASSSRAFQIPLMKGGNLSYEMSYNVDQLRRMPNILRILPKVFAHEIGGMVDGYFMEKAHRARGEYDFDLINDGKEQHEFDIGLSLFAEGFACYLSNTPFTSSGLLALESSYLGGMTKGAIDKRTEGHIKDRHFFAALALTKIELAFGRQRIADLMLCPPGLRADGSNIDTADLLQNLYSLYCEANMALKESERFGLLTGTIPIADFALTTTAADYL